MSLWIDKKYLKLVSPKFRNVKWKDDKVLNHSCPYCGDSSKNQLKARDITFNIRIPMSINVIIVDIQLM